MYIKPLIEFLFEKIRTFHDFDLRAPSIESATSGKPLPKRQAQRPVKSFVSKPKFYR